MKMLSRVVWSEGMYLAPHHFQTQSRLFEDSLSFVASSLWREPWGMLHLLMDQESLANGTIAVRYAAGIFPDGLCFDMPGADALPAPVAVSSIAEATDSELTLYLAIAPRRDNGVNVTSDENEQRGARFSVVDRTLRDETNGVDEQRVGLAQKNIRIVSSREVADGTLTIPIARIARDTTRGFRYDPDFIPCLLHTDASEVLLLAIKRLIEVVAEKSTTIARPVEVSRKLQTGSLPMDIANYWFLHALHSAIPALRHLVLHSHAHPSECFLELSRLAGALCTFALDSDPRELPVYDHVDPGPGFRALCAHIYRHLEIVVPTSTVALKFHATAPYLYSAEVEDERCLRRSRWILGIRSSLGESEQLRLVPRLVKVCSTRFVQELVKRALPGMTLTHLQVPPAALRAAADMQYYAIDTAGPCWQHILNSRSVGVYIPGEIADPDFTLSVVTEPTS
ncbi:type VI secretion system protein ImpJ [Granulicella aggregans]|uniref:Type VI secretion system protein ImpJ n=1 Tax=Granulicella aggregans TaxID=474949 RepID=A0A7W7ZI59_9BACT|nr:type VI secretion system baseplate subunit TssK [Granulicella aggregans]MBB5060370.1 type VI secretion system protein ImpJ [Granulicella aggregans]